MSTIKQWDCCILPLALTAKAQAELCLTASLRLVVSPPVSRNISQEVSTGGDAPDFGEGNTNRKSHTLVQITVKSPRIKDRPTGR